jgi:hypothetical protein
MAKARRRSGKRKVKKAKPARKTAKRKVLRRRPAPRVRKPAAPAAPPAAPQPVAVPGAWPFPMLSKP